MGVSFPARRTKRLLMRLGDARLALLAAALVSAAPARALEDIAVVDYQMIFDKYEATADAQRTLDLEMKQWEQDAKEMRDEIAKLGEELESQKLMLSEERLKEKQDLLRQKKDEYETFAESTFGQAGKAAQRNLELTKPIAEKILETIERIGQERNLKVIFDAGTGGVVWAEDDVNVTQTILDELSSSVTGAVKTDSTSVTPPPPPVEEQQGAGDPER